MKKNIIFITSIACGIILFIFVYRYVSNSRLQYISKNLLLDITNCTIERDKDTHDGFLGDGDYFAKLTCSEKEEKEIKTKWKILPISSELQKVLDMKKCDNDGCKSVFEKYSIPNITNGYYYFYDRHSESKDNSEKEINKRSSYNFSIGIYDSDNDILYYYELDT